MRQFLNFGKGLVLVFLAILMVLASAPPAWAHRVLVFAYVEGNNLFVESKLVPDTPVKEGKVIISDKQSGQVLASGQTDTQGKFSCPLPPEAAAKRADLLIVVEAGMGHKGEWLLKADKYLPAGAAPTASGAPTPPPTPAAAPAATAGTATPAGPAAQAVAVQDLEAAVARVMARELAPVKEMLAELTVHRTSLTDILGGLGYILGIFGLWAYFLSKKSGQS
jgi:nickel transport protein